MVERSRRSVGATIAAARAALAEGVAANLAGGTHHASAARGSGSASSTTSPSPPGCCRPRRRAGRGCASVDLDVHQGNGTAAIFAGDAASSRSRSTARRTSRSARRRATSTSRLPDGCGDADYLAALDARPRRSGARHARRAVRSGLLSRRRRPARRRPARPAEAQRRRPARARPPRPRRARARAASPSPWRWPAATATTSTSPSRSRRRRSRPRSKPGTRGGDRRRSRPSTIRDDRQRALRRQADAWPRPAIALVPTDALDGQRRLRPSQQRRLPEPVRHRGQLGAGRCRPARHRRRRG